MIPKVSKVDAIYRRTGVSHYDGNPLIEALPPIMDLETASRVLSNYVDVEPGEMAEPRQIRSHCVGRTFSLVQEAPVYFEVQSLFAELLRGGYVGRNPLDAVVQHHLYTVSELAAPRPHSSFKATSGVMALNGPSGQGKSTMITRIIGCYPQVIQHYAYGDRHLLKPQVVWLYMECPHDGSLSAFCMAFFEALDAALGTSHAAKFRRKRVQELMSAMRQLCTTYDVGVLVVDELQHLSLAKAGGKKNMMNFFVNLVNMVGVPLVLVGTYKATSLFQDAMRDARRASGDGLKDFRRPAQGDPWWDLLVETVWDLQWTREKTPLTPRLKVLLYDLSQGITDILIKLMVLAQRRALRNERECITEADFHHVANHDLVLLKPAIAALRKGSAKAMELYEDLLPTKEEIEKHIAALEQASADSAQDVMDVLRRARSAAKPQVAPVGAAPAAAPAGRQEDRIAEIRRASDAGSLLKSAMADDVHADLKARNLIPAEAAEPAE